MALTSQARRGLMEMVKGVGVDAEIVTDATTGAKQSAVSHRCDLLPPLATLHVAGILHGGSLKYGDWNWFKIPMSDNLNHALVHIFAFLAGDTSDDHLGHAACRMMMALERQLANEKFGTLSRNITPCYREVGKDG